ncbi:hypothetical protein [Roseibium aggregatum]|uniref:hypothetical protein n=1 Tax=Roseibium aggregatum TaxID=187304 RepID=UPI001A8EE3A0|nr:hypothetical protein [Roseibium aggregatum]MBN8185058.1 hypothetical protein [Roseibium aggregatum]
MTGVELRHAVFELVESHPNITPTAERAHAHMFRTSCGQVIGIEPERVQFQNIFVSASDVDLSRVVDIPHKLYSARDYKESRPNHNLFGADGFDDIDLICFKVTELWQAVRVIFEVAGTGGKP